METTYQNLAEENSKNERTTASLIHLSTLLKFFFPFANYIAPLLIWSFNKEKDFVDANGRQAINFQLSILVYTLLLFLLCIPIVLIFGSELLSIINVLDSETNRFPLDLLQNLTGFIIIFSVVLVILIALYVFQIYAVINATIHANRGELYKYPLCIPFIRTNQKPS